MEIVSITQGVTYPTAVELPSKKKRLVNGTHKSSSGNSGSGKHTHRITIPGKMHAELMIEAQRQTEANRKMLVLDGTGKRRWVRLADWEKKAT